jgi:hypothetical protein
MLLKSASSMIEMGRLAPVDAGASDELDVNIEEVKSVLERRCDGGVVCAISCDPDACAEDDEGGGANSIFHSTRLFGQFGCHNTDPRNQHESH